MKKVTYIFNFNMNPEVPPSQEVEHSGAYEAMNAEHLVEKTWEMTKMMAFWFMVLLVSVSVLGHPIESITFTCFSLGVFFAWSLYQKRWYVFARYVIFINAFVGCVFVTAQYGTESYAYFCYLPIVLAILSSFGSNVERYGIASLFLVSGYYIKHNEISLGFNQPTDSLEEFRFLFILITMGLCYTMTARFLDKNREFRLRLKGMLLQLQENEIRLQENCRLEAIQVKQFEIANEKLAEEVQNRIKAERQLSSSNEQLAQFSYAASHDLKEPLRSISGFIQLIQRKGSNINHPAIEEHTSAIFKSSQKMTALLDELLEYSLVDLNKVVRTLCHFSKALEGVEINISKLPEVFANKKSIEQLLSKILLNAVQYPHEKRSLSVTISSYTTNDKKIAIRVSDNGRGVVPHAREQVFQLFNQRLCDKGVADSGVGLPICGKIIENLGGEIWFEPNENEQGIACVFTLSIYEKSQQINHTSSSRIIQEV